MFYANHFVKAVICIVILSCSWAVSSQTLSVNSDPVLKFNSGISAIHHDSQGRYWFGSLKQGLAVLDGQHFKYFTHHEGLIGDQIRSIQEDQSGTIWIATDRGVHSYEGGAFKLYKPSSDAGLMPFNVMDAPKSHAGNGLWFNAGNQPGAYRMLGGQLKYMAYPKPSHAKPKNTFLTTDHAPGANGIDWLATYSAVFGYDGQQFSVIDDAALQGINPRNVLHVRSVFEDSKGQLWIGNNGIGVLKKQGNAIINFSEQMGLVHAESKGAGGVSPAGTLEHVFDIEEDRNGHMWFGDRDTGVWRFDGHQMLNYNSQHGLLSNSVRTIKEDNQGQVWVGLNDGGVYVFNGTGFERKFGENP